MQPITLLNNVQKAKLLHALLIQQIPAFLDYTLEVTTYMRENPAVVREAWKVPLFHVDFWLQLAAEADTKIKRHGKQLHKSSSLFADQLFNGYLAFFLCHCLNTYVDTCKHEDPKFKLQLTFLNPDH